ncbi:MAG: DUF6600 domain-containing protein [Vicinamibacteria bacterium]
MVRTAYVLTGMLTVPVLLTSVTLSFGQSGRTYNYAHVRYAEGGATLQRALEPEAGEAAINVPVMPGDRLWTAFGGRVEVLFADGTVLQMDESTKVDFTAFAETAGGETLLRLWNGSLFLRIVDASSASYRIDTPSGSIFPASEGLFRIDVDENGSATLSIYEGVAELASETGSVLVRTGQRSFVQPGLRPESPFEFNTALFDAFASWSDGREQLQRYSRRIEGVPDELAVYTGELQRYGSWRQDSSYGAVWYPNVSVGWSPYTQGSWSYTPFGWTWISYEPWGWAPYHYGRWGYGSFGWYWIPGSYWGPAWVSWAFGPSWVGWCPLGSYNRPFFSYRSVFDYGGGGYGSGYPGHGWSFVKKDHFRSVPVERTRLRVGDIRATANQGSLFESGAILDRELRPVAVGTTAMSRATGPSNRATFANAPDSASSSRTGLRRGARGTPQTLERSSPSGTYAVPRLSTGSSDDTTGARTAVPLTGKSTEVGGRTTDVTGRTTGEATVMSNRGGYPAGVIESSRGTATARTPGVLSAPTGPFGGVTRGPVERSMGRSAGSKDFFGRGPSSVVGPRSENAGARATPRTSSPSGNRSSQASSRTSGSSGSSNRNDNRGSSRPRN